MANENNHQHKTHRAVELIETLTRLGGSARTSHLADTMNVSEETIRRTVKKLVKEGTVSRVHGGVFLVDAQGISSMHQRIGENREEKRSIANFTSTLIPDHSSVFLDVGSTSIFIAEALRDKKKLTIITNSISVAQTLMNHNNNQVFLAGGELQSDLGGTFGSQARKFVAKFRADFALLSAVAVDSKKGFLVNVQDEADLAEVFVENAHKSIMIADHSKFGQLAPMVSCDPADIDMFITDERPSGDIDAAMKKWGIKILLAPVKKKKHK